MNLPSNIAASRMIPHGRMRGPLAITPIILTSIFRLEGSTERNSKSVETGLRA